MKGFGAFQFFSANDVFNRRVYPQFLWIFYPDY